MKQAKEKEKAEQMTMQEAYRMNAVEIAKHHKKNCDGEDCNISLILLRLMAEGTGVVFNKEDLELFI